VPGVWPIAILAGLLAGAAAFKTVSARKAHSLGDRVFPTRL
jgi:hypothetical protein